eukprot:s1523_g5.t1
MVARKVDASEDESEEVQEHLKDAVEGTLRLKRLLSQDSEDGFSKKKRAMENSIDVDHRHRIDELLEKWDRLDDRVMLHVLEGLETRELEYLANSSFVPDESNWRNIPADQVATQVAMWLEGQTLGGGPLDMLLTFRDKWKLGLDADGVLRTLSHKDLRYVMDHYDGTQNIGKLVAEAKKSPPLEGRTEGCMPDAPGLAAIGRFHRLELIDPTADAAVFGDANLSFALNLARHRKVLGHVGRVIATTFESLETLRERYEEIDETIKTLEEHYAEVHHEIDCTRIAMNPKFKGLEGAIGAVYYNFPHAGAVGGFFDGHPVVNWRHENLMRLFFRALRSFMKVGGLVKVASNMGAVGVRFSYITFAAKENEFDHVGGRAGCRQGTDSVVGILQVRRAARFPHGVLIRLSERLQLTQKTGLIEAAVFSQAPNKAPRSRTSCAVSVLASNRTNGMATVPVYSLSGELLASVSIFDGDKVASIHKQLSVPSLRLVLQGQELSVEDEVSAAGLLVPGVELTAVAKADDAFDAIVSESDPKLRKWMAMVMKKETEVAMAHPKYPSKTPTARPCKAKADDAFDAIVSESDPKLGKWMAMVMKKETEVAMAQKETEVAQAKMALLQSQLDHKNRDLLAARGEMSARYMLERYVDRIKAEACPAETRTKPLLRQVQKLQNQSSAAQQMVDAVNACATLSNQPSAFLSDLFAHVSGQFHFPNWCGPGIKVSPSLHKAERCVLLFNRRDLPKL